MSRTLRWLSLIVAGAALAASGRARSDGVEVRPLREGAVREREVAAGDAHAYPVELAAGHFLQVVVVQRGVDVAVTLEDPSGADLLTVDGPNGPDGPESLAAIAGTGGVHRLRVRAAAGAGGYRLEVAALRRPGDNDRRLARALREYARAEALRGQAGAAARRQALDGYRAVLELAERLGEPLLEARAHRRTGQVLTEDGDALEACRHLDAAVDLVRAHGNDWELLPLLNDAGVARLTVGRAEASLAVLEEALAIGERLGYGRGKATALSSLGWFHHSLGELQAALGYYDRSLAERRAAGDPGRTGAILHNLGRIYTSLGRFEDARDLLGQALDVHRQVGDRRAEGEALTALGWLSYLEDDFEAASADYGRALAILGEDGDSEALAGALEGRASVSRETGRTEEALAGYRRALAIFERRGRHLDAHNTLLEIGRLRTATGDAEGALDSLGRALAGFAAVGAAHGEALARLGMARAERARGRRAAALGHFEAALDRVDALRAGIHSGALRTSYAATRHDDYGAYVDLLMELDERERGAGWAARAFEASERVRARSLLESLAAAPPAGPPELAARRAEVRRAIRARERRRLEASAGDARGAEAAVLDRELRALLLEDEKLEGELRAAGGAPAAGRWTLARIREEILDADTLLLVYRLGEARSFLWLVGRERFEAHVLPARSELEPLARRVHALLPRSHERGRLTTARLALETLSDEVLGPVLAGIEGKRLVIVGDGALQLVPFGVLPVPGGRGPLLDRHEVVHLPSVAVLGWLRAGRPARPPAGKLLAMIADPVFQASDPRLGGPGPGEPRPSVGVPAAGRDVERSIRDFGLDDFARLPYSGDEAEAVLGMVPAAERFAAVGLAANRDTVLGGGLRDYRIVHFATHGLLNARHPALSGLVLSRVDAGGRPRPGFLWAHELAELELRAELVVLSACRTALGREVLGEGLVGMTRGFFQAGAPRVVVSHWNVNDRATAELMRRFYHGLLEDGLRPAAALRAAQLALRAEPRWRAPYFWAGFTLQGEWR